MWQTSRGNRTLCGAEADLVSNAIDAMIDDLLIQLDEDFDEDQTWENQYGLQVFDSLTASQRLRLLYDIAKYLLCPTDDVLPLSAATEAAVAAIFVEIRDSVAIEIDLCDSADEESQEPLQSWRDLVLTAARSGILEVAEISEGDESIAVEESSDACELPGVDCRDKELWTNIIDQLADTILWDRDFEMADSFLDADPGISLQRRRLLGIDDDYFTHIAPDPRPDEIEALVGQTRAIVRGKPR